MVKKIITEKIKDGKTFFTSEYLRVKLNNTISDRKARYLLENETPEFGKRPKYYSKETMDKVLKEYLSDDYNRDRMDRKVHEREAERALSELKKYDDAPHNVMDDIEGRAYFVVKEQFPIKRIEYMLRGLLDHFGLDFDDDLLYSDLLEDSKYELSHLPWDNRDDEQIKRDRRLGSSASYIKPK